MSLYRERTSRCIPGWSTPNAADKAPVVLVIHEIFGMSDWVRGVADQLAAEGFIALAPDMLSGIGPNGGGTDSLGDQVGQNIRKLTVDGRCQASRCRPRLCDGPARRQAGGRQHRILLGRRRQFRLCHAPAQAQRRDRLLRHAAKSDTIANIACPVLGLYGGDDGRITLTVDDTKKAMASANKSYDPHVYDGAGHGFLRQQEGRNGANLKASASRPGRRRLRF